jgi:hypothetical protein
MVFSELQNLSLMNAAGVNLSAAQFAYANSIAKTAIKTTKTT